MVHEELIPASRVERRVAVLSAKIEALEEKQRRSGPLSEEESEALDGFRGDKAYNQRLQNELERIETKEKAEQKAPKRNSHTDPMRP